jgi:hypothetical protein
MDLVHTVPSCFYNIYSNVMWNGFYSLIGSFFYLKWYSKPFCNIMGFKIGIEYEMTSPGSLWQWEGELFRLNWCYCLGDIMLSLGRLRLKCDGTLAETRFCLSAKRTSLFKLAGVWVQLIIGSRVVCISDSNGSNAGCTMFRGSVKGTGCPLHLSVSPFTFPPMHCHVPSRFSWTLLSVLKDRSIPRLWNVGN